jgi:DNA-binding beta-propeller fold protein YncE
VGLLATVAIAGRVGPGGSEPSRQPSRAASATQAPPVTTAPRSAVVATIGTGGFPYGMAFGAGSLWVAGGDHVSRIDPVSNRVEATIPLGMGAGHAAVGPSGLAFGAGAVWVPMAVPGAVWRIDPASNRVVARISLGGPLREAISVSATRGAVWVASHGEGERGVLLRVDPARQRVVAEIPLDGVPTAVAASPTAAWVATTGGRVLVVDAKRNRVAGNVNTGGGPLLGFSQTIALGGGGVWLAEPFAEQVVRIDPANRRVVDRIPAGAATNLAVGQGAVWVVSSRGLLRIDIDEQRVVAAVPASELRLTLLVTTGGGAVWAAGWNSVARIDPGRVAP